LDTDVPEKYYLSEKMLSYFSNRAANFNQGKVNIRDEDGKASCLTSSMASCDISDNFIKVDTDLKPSINQSKANCFTAGGNSGGLHSDMTLIIASRGRNPENAGSRESGIKLEQSLEPRLDGKTNCLTSVQKDNLVLQINPSKESGGKQPYQQNRIYDPNGISPALCAGKSDLLIISGTLRTHNDGKGFRPVKDEKAATIPARGREDGSGQNAVSINHRIRRLTPTECEKLQTVPVGYTAHVSDSQRYKMLGNGWTISVIVHILSYFKPHD
jgi:hypothetical protein